MDGSNERTRRKRKRGCTVGTSRSESNGGQESAGMDLREKLIGSAVVRYR